MDRKLILVVEDEVIERNLIIEVLDTLGYDAMEANNGLEALEVLKGNPIDLILTDIHMPEINGIELLKQLRSNKEDLPVILMTGFNPNEAYDVIKKYKSTSLLLKPFRLHQLKDLLDDYLQRH